MAGLLPLINIVTLFQSWLNIFMSSRQTILVLGILVCLVPRQFNYTFDRLSEIIENILKTIGFTHFGLYMPDYGGPVGFRIISRHPEWLEWLIIQNSNAYEVGFTNAWDGFRNALWKNRTPETEDPLFAFLQYETC